LVLALAYTLDAAAAAPAAAAFPSGFFGCQIGLLAVAQAENIFQRGFFGQFDFFTKIQKHQN
jgi:hypothetical protein